VDLEKERKIAAALTDNLYESIRDGWTYRNVRELWQQMKTLKGKAACLPSCRKKCDETKRCREFDRKNEQLAKDYYRQCRPVRIVLHLMMEERE
jgi:hypothetical protein